MCIWALGVWVGAMDGEEKVVEFLESKSLNLSLAFHIIILVYICQIWRIDHVLVTNFKLDI